MLGERDLIIHELTKQNGQMEARINELLNELSSYRTRENLELVKKHG